MLIRRVKSGCRGKPFSVRSAVRALTKNDSRMLIGMVAVRIDRREKIGIEVLGLRDRAAAIAGIAVLVDRIGKGSEFRVQGFEFTGLRLRREYV